MAKSIMQKERECYVCGSTIELEEHHVFGGVANRKISETYGLKVYLCVFHHRDLKNGAQYDKELNLKLKQDAQRAFQNIYGRRLWMQLIRKNYLGE